MPFATFRALFTPRLSTEISAEKPALRNPTSNETAGSLASSPTGITKMSTVWVNQRCQALCFARQKRSINAKSETDSRKFTSP